MPVVCSFSEERTLAANGLDPDSWVPEYVQQRHFDLSEPVPMSKFKEQLSNGGWIDRNFAFFDSIIVDGYWDETSDEYEESEQEYRVYASAIPIFQDENVPWYRKIISDSIVLSRGKTGFPMKELIEALSRMGISMKGVIDATSIKII